MAGSGFMILCFQSTPQARLKMGEANLGTPPRSKTFQKKQRSESWHPDRAAKHFKKTPAKHFKNNTTTTKKPTPKNHFNLSQIYTKKCSFSHINAYLCNNFYKNQQSYN